MRDFTPHSSLPERFAFRTFKNGRNPPTERLSVSVSRLLIQWTRDRVTEQGVCSQGAIGNSSLEALIL